MSDPRAPDLLSTVPDDVGALGDRFGVAASRSQDTAGGLKVAQSEAAWTGPAADSYRHAIGAMTSEVAGLRPGFAAASQALSAYESEVSALKRSFTQVIAQLQEAEAHDREQVPPLQAQAMRLLDEFDAARTACRSAVSAAQATIAEPSVSDPGGGGGGSGTTTIG